MLRARSGPISVRAIAWLSGFLCEAGSSSLSSDESVSSSELVSESSCAGSAGAGAGVGRWEPTKRLCARCAPLTVPFVVTGVGLSLPAEKKRVAGLGGSPSLQYFDFNSAILRIAPVCFTAEPELSVEALDSVLAARAAGRCEDGTSVADGLLGVTTGFGTGTTAGLRVRCREPTDSSSVSPSLDA